MSSSKLTLYCVRVSPPCRAVWLYMLQHKIPHTLVDVDFSESSKAKIPETIKRNCHQEVPILTDGEIIVFEGPVILRYLANKYTNFAGYGVVMADRMFVESVICWASNHLHRVIGYQVVYPQFFDKYRLLSQSATDAMIEAGTQQLIQYLDILENKYLTKHKYMCGSTVTVADYYVATILMLLDWMHFSLRIWPRLSDWLGKITKEGHWKDVHAAHNDFLQEINKCCLDY
ncbi:glutathione S-transferase theta-1-like [Glandiceps talaboti]